MYIILCAVILWINFRLILAILGHLTLGFGILMLICGILELFDTQDNLDNFVIIGVLFSFAGFIFAFSNKNHISSKMTLKNGFLLTILGWFWITFIASLPLYFANLDVTFIDCLFESMSAFTTTGSTIFNDLNKLSSGLQLWRALLQWIGGIGIILTGTALISQLSKGGMQLFKIESFETFDNSLDKAINLIKGIIKIYIALTIIFFFALWFIGGLSPFDSLIHTLTNLSTAGFSNKNESVGYFNNSVVYIIVILMMICGGTPFILIYYSIFLKKPSALLNDEQFRCYIMLIVILSLILAMWLFFYNNFTLNNALIYGCFTVVSYMTGTGSAIGDFTAWGYFPTMFILMVMFIGGCGGSSACGMKVYRLLIAFRMSKVILQRIYQKNHIIYPYYNKNIIDDQFAYSVFAYMFLMLLTIAIVALILSIIGLDFATALSGSISCLMNIGAGVGPIIGPAGNFSSLPESAKLVLTFAMFIGRIEIFGAYVLFYKSFWNS